MKHFPIEMHKNSQVFLQYTNYIHISKTLTISYICPIPYAFKGTRSISVPVRLCTSFRGGSRIFFRRGCTRLLLYFNTNKPHSFFEYQLYEKTAGHLRGGVRTPCTLPLDPPLSLHMYHAFLYINFHSWHDSNMRPPNFMRPLSLVMEYVNTTQK